MKKMSEVFELPIDHKKLELYEAGELQGVPYHVAEEHAAHAINHVDELADALEDLINDIENNLNPRYSFDSAVAALAAYRGEK